METESALSSTPACVPRAPASGGRSCPRRPS